MNKQDCVPLAGVKGLKQSVSIDACMWINVGNTICRAVQDSIFTPLSHGGKVHSVPTYVSYSECTCTDTGVSAVLTPVYLLY